MYTCNENIHQENLHKLLESSKISVDHKQFLKTLQKHMKKSTSHTLTFQTTEKIGKKPAGRLYTKFKHPSLQICPRQLRGALGTEYVEVDIVNCFPAIFCQMFEQNNIAIPSVLTAYVSDREAFVASTGHDKRTVKDAMNSAMNFGYSLSCLDNFGQEFRESFRSLCAVPFYKKYFDLGKTRAENPHPDEPYKKAVHFVGSDVERQIVMSAIQTFQDAGFETSTVIHDGFLVRTADDYETFMNNTSDILSKCTSNAATATGYKLQFSVKELPYEPDQLFDDTCAPMVDEDMTDYGAAVIFSAFMDDLGFRFKKSNGQVYMYDPNTHVWSEKVDGWRSQCAKCEELGDYGKSTPRQNQLWVQFEDSLIDEEQLMFEFTEQNYMKIAFQNGYYDFQTKEFTLWKHAENVDQCGFFEKVKYDWETPNQELVTEIWNKCILEVYGKEQGEFLLAVMGRAAAGYVEDKMLYIILGNTNSGKGVMVNLLEKAFGKGYVGTFNTGVLQHKSVPDEAKGLSFMVALKDKRFLIGSEASRAAVFDSQKINMLCSGGDTICARQNNKDEMEFKMAGTTFMFCNDMSKINGLDDSVANRLRFIEPKFSFLAGSEYVRKQLQPNVKKADDSIKTHFVKRNDVGQAFAMMVCLAFKDERPREPAQVVQQNSDWLNAEDVEEALERLVVRKPGGLVACEDLYKQCQGVESLKTMSQNKITRTLTVSFGVPACVFRTPAGQKRQKRCYLNIELVEDINDGW